MSCAYSQNSPSVVRQWNTVLLNQALANSMPSQILSRSIMILNTAMYDTWACYNDVALGTRFSYFYRRPAAERTIENMNIAISFAAYRVMADLFPTSLNSSTLLMQNFGYNISDFSENIQTPIGLGNRIARVILEYKHYDGSNQLGSIHPGNYSDYTFYQPVNPATNLVDINHWQPQNITNGTQSFILSHWGLIHTFTGVKVNFTAPPLYPSPEFTDQLIHMINISGALNDTHKMVAEFWNVGPNAEGIIGIWLGFAHYVSNRDNYTLGNDTQMFYILGNALHDVAILTTYHKRKYDYVRPITAIRHVFNNISVSSWGGPGAGSMLILGNTWTPYLQTPPSPEYFSDHSAYSAACAEVLIRFTGNDYLNYSFFFANGSSMIEPGMTPSSVLVLNYTSFSQAANDAAISRRYAGVNFLKSDLDARTTGRLIGHIAYLKSMEYISGIVNTTTTFSTNVTINDPNPFPNITVSGNEVINTATVANSASLIHINLFLTILLIFIFF